MSNSQEKEPLDVEQRDRFNSVTIKIAGEFYRVEAIKNMGATGHPVAPNVM
jgi:hypothetical protein